MDNLDSSSSFRNANWGIIGTGQISKKFATALDKAESAVPYAVASRSRSRAESFAKKHDIANAYDHVDALGQDSELDIVYVGSPTRVHRHHVHTLLDHGKAVLCEKPFGRNHEEAQSMVQKARSKSIFCMEAMWMRFNPLVQQAKQALDSNQIGTVRSLHGELGYKKDPETLGHAADGRGALLAFGCYGISLALFLFGKPTHIQSGWIPNQAGGDETAALTLYYDDKIASFRFSERVTLSNDVQIKGTEGAIHLGSPFIDARELQVINLKALENRSLYERVRDKARNTVSSLFGQTRAGSVHTLETPNTGFQYEIEEATRCVQSGKTESNIMPLEDTLTAHRILDIALASSRSSQRIEG